MKRFEKNMAMERPTLGYWSALGGLEVKELNDEYCVVLVNAWSTAKSIHKVKVYYNNRGGYIRVNGTRYYFDECLRV